MMDEMMARMQRRRSIMDGQPDKAASKPASVASLPARVFAKAGSDSDDDTVASTTAPPRGLSAVPAPKKRSDSGDSDGDDDDWAD